MALPMALAGQKILCGYSELPKNANKLATINLYARRQKQGK